MFTYAIIVFGGSIILSIIRYIIQAVLRHTGTPKEPLEKPISLEGFERVFEEARAAMERQAGQAGAKSKPDTTLFAPAQKGTELNLQITNIKAVADLPKPLRAKANGMHHAPHSADIRTLAEGFKIPFLVHFTRCENLESILRHGFHSVASCEALKLSVASNDKLRLDEQPDGISFSIAFPNYRMFYKYRKSERYSDWAVLRVSPEILWEKECGFYKNNAADNRMRHRPREMMMTPQALRDMFESPDARRDEWLHPYDPTDSQAEILVYETVEPRFIEAITFETQAIANHWRRVCNGIETNYAERNNGLFAERERVRKRHPISMQNFEVPLFRRLETRITSGSAEDEELFSALKLKLVEIARAEGVSPYAIFHNSILIEMATARPQNLDQLAQIEGIGEMKIKRYGQTFLDIIAGQ